MEATAPPSTRERLVREASRLLQRRGYAGTGIKQVADAAGASLGSMYHFFPGGKQELIVAAWQHGSDQFAASLSAALESAAEPTEAVVACARLLAAQLRDTDWVDRCSYAAMEPESVDRTPELRQAISDGTARWKQLVADKLRAAGLPELDAEELADTVLNTLEGALLASQLSRSEEPLERAGRHLARLIATYR